MTRPLQLSQYEAKIPNQWPGIQITPGTAKKFNTFFDFSKPLIMRAVLKIIKLVKRLFVKQI